jgi:RNA polymerase sigma-70 factor (ECF subfamily)
LFDEFLVCGEVSDDMIAEVQDLRRRVRSALAELPEAQRSVVLLHRFEGMTFGEIATILSAVEGRPLQEGAVRVRAFRAYATLRNVLVGPDEEAEGAIE